MPELDSKTEPATATAASQTKTANRNSRWRRMLILLILFGGGSLAFVEFYLRRPMGEGPAGPKIDATPFSTTWSDKSIVLLGIGDSVTAGFGAKNPSHSYFARLAQNPVDEWPDMQGLCLSKVLPKLTQKNISVSGSTSLQHFDAIRDRLPSFQPDEYGIVVMTTGGNDIIHNYGRSSPKEGAMYGATVEQAEPWIANFEQRLATMLEEITQRFPGGCEIYLADIYDPTDGVGDALSVYLPKWPDGIKIHARYNEVIRKTAQQFSNVHLVELHKTFLGHGSHCRQFWRSHYDRSDPNFWVYENIEDPNDRGYDAIRRIFLKTIIECSVLRPSKD